MRNTLIPNIDIRINGAKLLFCVASFRINDFNTYNAVDMSMLRTINIIKVFQHLIVMNTRSYILEPSYRNMEQNI